MEKRSIYLIGSLRDPNVPKVAARLRLEGYEVFDDWYAAGPEADDYWQKYEKERGHTYQQALDGYAANHVYSYDRSHLDRCSVGVMLLPAGKSAHLELGYIIGSGKPGYIVLDKEPERYDVMYRFATKVCNGLEELCDALTLGTMPTTPKTSVSSVETPGRKTTIPYRSSPYAPSHQARPDRPTWPETIQKDTCLRWW